MFYYFQDELMRWNYDLLFLYVYMETEVMLVYYFDERKANFARLEDWW